MNHSSSQKKQITNERILIEALIRFLKIEGYEVFIEVPNMGQSTDIVAKKNRWLTFIEAKMRDWKRGLKQCIAHETVADFICLAVSSHNLSPGLIHHATERGYGIIHCNQLTMECLWKLKPIVNKKIWLPQRQVLLKTMRSIENEH